MKKTAPTDISTYRNGKYAANVQAIFESWGLYDWVDAWAPESGGLAHWASHLIWVGHTVDLYCVECGKQSVFTRSMSGSALLFMRGDALYGLPTHGTEFIQLDFTCAHNPTHTARILICFKPYSVSKVGQYPSLADLSFRELDQYKAVLGDDLLREMKKGVGLHSHGIGAGALIYLRRIFEFIISSAEKSFVANHSAQPYEQTIRMREKIKVLKEFLPDFVVEQNDLYGILSDGLHNRSEEECEAFFSPCLDGICLALDELEAARSKLDRVKKAKNDLAKVAAMVKEAAEGDSKVRP